MNGSIDGLSFNYNPLLNLGIGESSINSKSINLTLGSGTYNINVNAMIPENDPTLSDNSASRQIQVTCPIQCNCQPDNNLSYCQNNNVYKKLTILLINQINKIYYKLK